MQKGNREVLTVGRWFDEDNPPPYIGDVAPGTVAIKNSDAVEGTMCAMALEQMANTILSARPGSARVGYLKPIRENCPEVRVSLPTL